MTYFKKHLLVGMAAVLVPGAAMAQDWNGVYGGLTFGYSIHDTKHTFSNGAPTDSSDPKGILYGGFAGYGYQTGNIVIGAEASFEGSNASGKFDNNSGISSSGKAELNWQGSARGILGYAANIGTMPVLFYGAVGWAYGDFDFQGGPSGGGYVGNGYSDKLNGLTLGLGADTRIGNNISVRAEYTYTDYGKSSGNLAPTSPGVLMPVSVKQHSFRIGIRKDF